MKFCAIDFEYNGTNNARYNLVAVAFSVRPDNPMSLWLHKSDFGKSNLKDLILEMRDAGYIFLSFNVDAEARSCISMGINPITMKWFDIQAEWKMMVNHWDKYRYGNHLIDGRVVKTRRLEGVKKKGQRYDRPPVNLLGCTYKLLGIQEDQTQKDRIRDIIINQTEFTHEQQVEILRYAESDIKNLHLLKDKILKIWRKKLKLSEEQLWEDILYRGETVARAAVIASTGYPIDRKKLETFVGNVPNIIRSCQEDINSQFPDSPPFYWNKREGRYSENQKYLKEWIINQDFPNWELTDKGAPSLKLEAWEKFFHFRHEFPTGNLGAQMLRYKRLIQSLNGFKPKGKTAKDRTTFMSYYGDDDRAHPYLNAYGAQSARFQPKAKGFIFLSASWLRSLVQPKKGRAICGIDYSQQEFLLAALISKDKEMINAYKSGDVYLYTAKRAGAVPAEGTRADYNHERNVFKATTLGISYGMGSAALARKLTVDTGKFHTPEDAQELIDLFYDSYKDYAAWAAQFRNWDLQYEPIRLQDGWTMFEDNHNWRSVANMPIQGMGSVILRRAIKYSQDSKIEIIAPLHDALYCEFDSEHTSQISSFHYCMKQAFIDCFPNQKEDAALIRLDVEAWSSDYEPEVVDWGFTKVKFEKEHIDERSLKEYEFFKKYL